MKKFFAPRLFTVLALSTMLLASCEEDPIEPKPGYQVPTTYNFENVYYEGQSDRLRMLEEISTYMKTATTPGTTLSAQKLKEMYGNVGNHFTFTSTRQLKDKTFAPDRETVENMMDALAAASASTTPGSNGVAGIVTSNDGTKKYLFDANGFEHIQLIEKGLMGSALYYQATGVYLTEDKTGDNIDNTTVKPNEGTPMQHHWDEAFGYFGVPKDYPANKTGLKFWGRYADSREAKLQSGTKIMNAFLKGRAAINNKDMKAKNEAITTIRTEWERASAASAISYLNQAKAGFADDAIRNHTLSEGIAFINALKYNPAKKITDAQIATIIDTLGTNLYNVTLAQINSARDQLSAIYGMDAMKDSL
ncbi:MAG TPA: DUF4856 domain-containing protein [Patescibacteria group bacterium]|nr:DUF4856 domain-containing protein [Patescibacteria group bacterium]